MGLMELLFAFIVVAAVAAVLFEPEQGGLLVMTIAMIAAFYQLALIVGPSLWLAIFAVFVAAGLKIIDELSGGDLLGDVSLMIVLDRVLTRLQGGGAGGRGGGGQQHEVQRRQRPPRIWEDQDDDD